MPAPQITAQVGRAVLSAMRVSRDVSTVTRVVDAARHPDRHRGTVFVALGLIGVVMLIQLFLAAPIAGLSKLLDGLGVRPTLNVAAAAYQASSTCDIGAGDARRGALTLVAQAYLATGAGGPSLARGASPFGVYRNPLADARGYDPMRGADRLHIDTRALRAGGDVATALGLGSGVRPRDWSTLTAVGGEHGLGFLLIRPSDWLAWTSSSPNLAAHVGATRRATLDPYQPYDAFLVMACHLRDIERAGGLTLGQALAVIGKGAGQLWTDVQAGLPNLRDRVLEATGGAVDLTAITQAASDLETSALAAVGLSASQLGEWYSEQVERFLAVRDTASAGSGTMRWPADPAPLPLERRGSVALPPRLWYPAVSSGGFVNPFPDPSQCTWFAYQAYAAFDGASLTGLVGDAGDWIDEALANASLRPRVLVPGSNGFGPVEGAVVVFARTSSMPYGHVGIVREVARDGQGAAWMLIWDANWDLRGGRYQHWEQWSVWAGRIAGFILPPPPPAAVAADTIRSLIDQAFAPLGAAAQQWGQSIAWCESRDDPTAVNPEPVGAEHAQGLFQFLPSTFAGTPPGRAGASIFDARASAEAAAWMYAQGRQAEWQCN